MKLLGHQTSCALLGVIGTAAALLIGLSNEALTQTAAGEIYQPKDDIERAAQQVLETHCARCHQAGKLEKLEKPSKGFGDILQLDKVSCNIDRVTPGNAEGSRIFKLIVDKEMPYDVYQEADFSRPSPSQSDIDALRSWINKLGQPSASDFSSIETASFTRLVENIAQDLAQQPDSRRLGTRYISLAHLFDGCTGEEEMKVYAQGVVKLLNSLSRRPDVVTLQTIDQRKSVIRFHLDDLGWDPALWDHIASQYPYGVRPANSQYDALAQATRSAVPYVRGDWFAYYAARPPLYERILNLPETFEVLQDQHKLNVDENISKGSAKRVGLLNSGVSDFHRLIERHQIDTGAFWTSYDFGGDAEARQRLSDRPLGPGGETGFVHDGGETIFNLPNGFQAYYLNKADGTYLDRAPIEIVRDPGRRDKVVTNGISCMGCHDQGMRKATDEIRPIVFADKAKFDLATREAVRTLYPEKADMDKLLQADTARFIAAMKKAELDPNLSINRIEMINSLSDRYERSLDMRTAAAEFGLSIADFQPALLRGGAGAGVLDQLLQSGKMRRGEFEQRFGSLVETVVDAAFITPSATKANIEEIKQLETVKSPDKPEELELTLLADKATFKKGERLVLTVTSNRDCHLTLVNIDDSGSQVVIFPNRFSQQNLLKSGSTFRFPPSEPAEGEKKYKFELNRIGTETVVAVCDETGTALVDVNHDFAVQAFTTLNSKAIDVVADVEPGSISRTAIKLTVDE